MPPNDEIAFATIPVLGAQLRSGVLSSTELTTFFLKRLEQHAGRYNCLVRLTRELALEQAASADAELKAGHDRGPLHGIPYGAKDLLATKGIPTSWGAAPYRDQLIDRDAAVVARLRQAGAVLVAKLAMVELAGGMGYHQPNASFTGPARNPWNPEKWAGGSSSGSGAAVAAGLVPFAIGTETWGSITTPASFCGLSGLRPTYGRVSRAGAMALAWTHDKIGPMARTAHDCGLILNAIAGPDDDDPTTAQRPYAYPPPDPPGRPYRLAVLKDGEAKAQPDARKNFKRALGVFGSLGTIEEVELPDRPWTETAETIIAAEGAAAFEELIDSGKVHELTAPEDRVGGYADQAILATEYLRALRVRNQLCRVLDQFLAPFDAVLTLATEAAAPPAEGNWPTEFDSKSLGGPGNVCGTPALVLPTGLTDDGLPTAIQLDGRAWSENRLLALGMAFQAATAWHEAHPKVA
jgi:aspartyl-tRNA(Asn)/glutamyl-tRNA(Gln) amidotransferase subunit A